MSYTTIPWTIDQLQAALFSSIRGLDADAAQRVQMEKEALLQLIVICLNEHDERQVPP